MGRPVGPYYQVYAPVQNENVFTNLWHGPFYGFRDVISTFQLTDRPRRLKPINIYFHFYSGSKLASLKALRQVFDWALAQDVVSVFASDYIHKVEDFQHLSLARKGDGCWQLSGDGALTTLRLTAAMGEVAGAVIATSLVLVAVFVPVAFITGSAKSLFVPMAMAVVFAMIASFILSRTLVPTMAYFLLKPHDPHARTAPSHALGRFQRRFDPQCIPISKTGLGRMSIHRRPIFGLIFF